MTQTSPIGFASRWTTTLTGGGRSVVGNTTIAFCVATILGATVAATFGVLGYPGYALIGFAIPYLPFLAFFFGTLRHVAAHPDSSVTSEEHYARVVEYRTMAAKDAHIVKDGPPVLGGSTQIVDALSPPKSGDNDV